MGLKVLTANRLTDGEAVWLAADRSWAETIALAEVAADAAGEESLERDGKAAFARNEVVDVNVIDVELVDGAIVPTRLRERIRATGPTTHSHLGKQSRAVAPGAD